jgi:predicted DNA-binding antitoxin AbrB/MazE fold protein
MMTQALKAIYHNGTFILQSAFNLPEGTEVEILVQTPELRPPAIPSLEARKQLLQSLLERMQQNPIPLNAPAFIRDILHERR